MASDGIGRSGEVDVIVVVVEEARRVKMTVSHVNDGKRE